jgi:hypothetical protein
MRLTQINALNNGIIQRVDKKYLWKEMSKYLFISAYVFAYVVPLFGELRSHLLSPFHRPFAEWL